MHQQDFYTYLLENNSRQLHTQPEDAIYHASSSAIPGPPQLDEDDKGDPGLMNAQRGSTDFRRRKNWSERILVEITGLMHVLSPMGDILYCSESTFELTGYRPHELVGQKLMEYLHIDDMDVFIRDFQMSFHTRSQIKSCYRFRKKDDSYGIFEVVGQPNVGLPDQPPQAFFGIAQPVPTKSCAMMDTFLELKTENDWLKRRVDELTAKYGKVSLDPIEHEMEPQDETEITNSLFMNNAVQSGSHNNPRNLIDEPTAWLNNQTGNLKNTLRDPKEDILLDEVSDKKDKWKRRKIRGADEYVCKDCGTTSSPEWRKGPQGAKTLCNACGLRWAKKNKKKNFNGD